MAIVLAIHSGHDAAAAVFDDYRILAAVQKERLSRIKKDHGEASACVDEVLSIAGIDRAAVDAVALTRDMFARDHFRQGLVRRLREFAKPPRYVYPTLNREMRRARTYEPRDVLDLAAVLRFYGLRADLPVSFVNHHFAHALPALFFTDWDDALIYTADRAGDNATYSHRIFKDGRLDCLYGDDRMLHTAHPLNSLGRAYEAVTMALGFRSMHHEGKVTGLAAWGQPVLRDHFLSRFRVGDDGVVATDFPDEDSFRAHFVEPCKGVSREDCAASIQAFAETIALQSIERLLARSRVRHIGLAGGFFANVRVNQRIAETAGIDELFVVPPMGDEGLVIGAGLHHLLERDGLARWLDRRYRLDDVYWGRHYQDAGRRFLAFDPRIRALPGDPAANAAELMAEGKVVALFAARMEFGPRALGARTILASPARRDINDSLNKRLDRSEFMPFAPVVAEEDASAIFDLSGVNRYACRFMTITCDVKREWRERIPAVVHVDGTARPQLIRRRDNPLYFDILKEFERRSGLPVAINTSFNVHEEPIINTPEEAARALVDDRVDYLVTEDGVYGLAAPRERTG